MQYSGISLRMKTTSANTELHELFEGRLKIYQKEEGYRFSVDTILLADFAVARSRGKVADLGTGSGILPVLLSRHNRFSEITGIEIQNELAELAKQNIRVNAILPAFVKTPMISGIEQFIDLEKNQKDHPLGLGNDDDIANSIYFLLSDASKWITGTNLIIDGGYYAK